MERSIRPRFITVETGVIFTLFLLMANTAFSGESRQETNRLSREKSPYLLQHAHNPVDWYPWGEEAFEKARSQGKPVILSIGYSTCHWCHVMEEESFEDPGIAAVMNQNFISIKVDREERPDLDAVYMNYVIAVTGRGGWPMTVFLTPDKRPFYGGTYFPPEDRFGMPGFRSLLLSIADAWKNRRHEIMNSADSAVSFLKQAESGPKEQVPFTGEVLDDAFETLRRRFDGDFGGFGPAPKFPMGHTVCFLLRYWQRSGNSEALAMVEKSLAAMAAGGVYDQVGGGFHRYSTDRRWFLPHFEKMLYDQAGLSRVYLEAYQATGKENYARISREILDYVLREMTDPGGAFYSAQDADSADPADPKTKREGAYYVWKRGELEALLLPEEAAVFSHHFGALENGNVEEDPQKEFVSRNVLYAASSIADTASHFKMDESKVREIIDRGKASLLQARAKRPRPHLDDKVLTDWNGLMIASFSYGSRVLNEPRYSRAAQGAARFISTTLTRKNGRLLHRFRDGEAGIEPTLDDYAFFIYGILELYQAMFDEQWLKEARRLALDMMDLFWDKEGGGFFLTSGDSEVLITRPKQDHDGALPSGNSVAVLDLLWLHRMTGERRFFDAAEKALQSFSALVISQPSGFTQMLMAFDFSLGPSYEIVIAKGSSGLALEEVMRQVDSEFLPNKVVLLHPFLREQRALDGKTTVYVCRDFTCDLPATQLGELKERLAKSRHKQV